MIATYGGNDAIDKFGQNHGNLFGPININHPCVLWCKPNSFILIEAPWDDPARFRQPNKTPKALLLRCPHKLDGARVAMSHLLKISNPMKPASVQITDTTLMQILLLVSDFSPLSGQNGSCSELACYQTEQTFVCSLRWDICAAFGQNRREYIYAVTSADGSEKGRQFIG